jgi:hypothetical protein
LRGAEGREPGLGAKSKGRGRKREEFRGKRQEAEGERRCLRGKMGWLDGEGGGSRHGKSREIFFSSLFRRERGKGLSSDERALRAHVRMRILSWLV